MFGTGLWKNVEAYGGWARNPLGYSKQVLIGQSVGSAKDKNWHRNDSSTDRYSQNKDFTDNWARGH